MHEHNYMYRYITKRPKETKPSDVADWVVAHGTIFACCSSSLAISVCRSGSLSSMDMCRHDLTDVDPGRLSALNARLTYFDVMDVSRMHASCHAPLKRDVHNHAQLLQITLELSDNNVESSARCRP